MTKLILLQEFEEEQVGHHCSLSPGERTLWRPTPFGSARQPDSLSLSIRSHSPPSSPASCHRRGRPPALHPSTSTLAPSRRLLPPWAASESGPWSSAESTLFATSADSALTLAIPRPLSFLPFHLSPRSYIPAAAVASAAVAAAADDDDFSARRRTLIPISKIRLPSKPRIDWQKHRQRAPPKAIPVLSSSTNEHP